MREIEFRVWDKKNNFMFFDGFNDWEKTKIETHDCLKITLGGKVVRQMKYADSNTSLARLEDWTGDYILMQYTGLLDKNGKKIFEGDIVKSSKDHYFIINYQYGSFGAEWIKDDKVWHSSATNSFDKNNFEVIGNIHENKSLLEE